MNQAKQKTESIFDVLKQQIGFDDPARGRSSTMDDTRAILEEHKKGDDQESSNFSAYNSSCCFKEEQDENDLVKEIE